MVEVYLESITHSYVGTAEAVRDVTLKMPHGSLNGLLGPSGCGKTTLMKIIAGLVTPTKGRVFFDGKDVTQMSPQARNVAMVFQFPVVYSMSAFDNMAFPLLSRGVAKQEARKKVLDVAELLGLTSLLDANAKKLDAGGRQRVALGRALVRDPNVFLLDEPLSNVDPETRLYLRAKTKEIQKTLGGTMIYVTHDQAEALTLSQRIALMKDGAIVQFDTPEALYEYPKNTFVAYFLGNPGMNLLCCSLREDSLEFGEFRYNVSEWRRVLDPHGNEFIMGIRPEYVQVSRKEMPGSFLLKCDLIENLGNMQLVHLVSGKTEIKSKLVFSEVPEGSQAWVNFPKDKVRIFRKNGEFLM
jgi:glycerol transport system ATP-binding protein